MNITFQNREYAFLPWKPALGRVFKKAFAFDTETTRIDEERPWLTPAYVLGAAFDGKVGYFVRREDLAAFVKAHRGVPIVFHSASFDLAVIHTLASDIDIYQCVDRNQVRDTQLLHRLYVLGKDGHAAGGKGESDLEHCADVYLGVTLPKDSTDSDGDVVRLSYGKWLNQPPERIEPVYLEYLARDVIATWRVYRKLRRLIKHLLDRSRRVWGFVSGEWLAQQVGRWGPLTHHIQLRASIALRAITANGLHLDVARRAALAQRLERELARLHKRLRKYGHIPQGKGSGKSLQAILKRLEWQHPDLPFPRTGTDLYATSSELLQDLADIVPFVKRLLEFRETQKLLSSFVGKMAKRVLHPSFNVLARTGRTSSFGEINAQNLPTRHEVRSCFVPSPGHVFVDCDYATIELATLAQARLAQFGLDSQMAAAINADQDLHTLVAARVTGKDQEEVSKADRKKAKPINFGKPGGMGSATLKQYAKASYGVQLTDEEVEDLSDAWFELFPEMKDFLADTHDTWAELAKLLDLTPASHYEHTGDRRFISHPENRGREQKPHAFLGAMALKAFREASPRTRPGKPYSATDLDYFWSRLEARKDSLPTALQNAVAQRKPSPRLHREVRALVGRAPVFILTGRLRARATYSARHNTVFQGLAADGAKLALWLLWRAGYRLANFIHDQVLVEVPAGSDLKRHAEAVRDLMVEGMKSVVPDVKIGVSYAATDRWYKDAEAVLDRKGKKLLLWQPPQAKEQAHAGA
jgi:DNA polymerase I-like protein with 3'-5' exonuclease and polymerase domains